MNKSKIRRVALALLTGELAVGKRHIGYNQGTYKAHRTGLAGRPDRGGHDCGTVACIAGHVTAIYDRGVFGRDDNIGGVARRILGINQSQADELFTGMPHALNVPNAKQAAMVLFHLAETGKVDWNVAV